MDKNDRKRAKIQYRVSKKTLQGYEKIIIWQSDVYKGVVKAVVLQCESVGFATQNSRFYRAKPTLLKCDSEIMVFCKHLLQQSK
ncbi:MAG: hypothetical protein ACTTI8_00750 [Prevotella intermedia]